MIDVQQKSEKIMVNENDNENKKYRKMLERSKERRIMQLKWSGLQFHEVFYLVMIYVHMSLQTG